MDSTNKENKLAPLEPIVQTNSLPYASTL